MPYIDEETGIEYLTEKESRKLWFIDTFGPAFWIVALILGAFGLLKACAGAIG